MLALQPGQRAVQQQAAPLASVSDGAQAGEIGLSLVNRGRVPN